MVCWRWCATRGTDPFNGALYVFRAKRATNKDRLVDGLGICLYAGEAARGFEVLLAPDRPAPGSSEPRTAACPGRRLGLEEGPPGVVKRPAIGGLTRLWQSNQSSKAFGNRPQTWSDVGHDEPPFPSFPDDIDALKAMIAAMAEQRLQLEARNDQLEARNLQLEAVNQTAAQRIARLTELLKRVAADPLWPALRTAERGCGFAFVFDECQIGIRGRGSRRRSPRPAASNRRRGRRGRARPLPPNSSGSTLSSSRRRLRAARV